jgi:hypothetical protein
VRLDHVVHDFMACLDPGSNCGVELGPGPESVERMTRILEYTPGGDSSAVLGPPVLCGMSPSMGVESLLGFLGMLKKTGMLRVRAGGTTYMISVVRGDVVNGTSDPRPEEELLGNLLVARGAIGRTRLERFLRDRASSACRLGEALTEQELVTTDELRGALEQQLQQMFDRMLAAESATWCFYEGEAVLSYIHVRMNVTSVLLESARKHDEGRGELELVRTPRRR